MDAIAVAAIGTRTRQCRFADEGQLVLPLMASCVGALDTADITVMIGASEDEGRPRGPLASALRRVSVGVLEGAVAQGAADVADEVDATDALLAAVHVDRDQLQRCQR
jgi:hypothetical protein